jgi:UDPglucose 6-dehydrogenase
MRTMQIKPCVVGLGKLGLPLATVIADAGFHTFGLDKNAFHIEILNEGGFTSPEPELNLLLERNKSSLVFTTEFDLVKDCDIYFLIVPTPSLDDGNFDNKFLVTALSDLLDSWKNIRGEKTIVIVSTVMPGTCQKIFLPIIEKHLSENENNLKINLLYSPEFIALGSVVYNLRNPDMTLIGCDSSSRAKVFLEVMDRITNGKPATQNLTLTEAEVVKLMVNCFVTMKISFANFIGEVSKVLPGTDKYKISKALGMDTRIGGKYLRPGLGFAGPCFPRDNTALIAFAQENGLKASLGLATDEINHRQPQNVVDRIKKEFPNLNSVVIIGITYKPHSSVTEKSQTLLIADLLSNNGFGIKLFDSLLSNKDMPQFEFLNSIEDISDGELVLISKEFEFMISNEKNQIKNLLVI